MTTTSTLNASERSSIAMIASILSLRLIGLFIILPVFSLYALSLNHASFRTVGIAAGIYGLTQAFAQLPFGWLSDRFSRKPVIAFGLFLFVLGSALAAYSTSIYTLIFARGLQGFGAIGSAALAFVADATRDHQRTKAMAITGIAIGFSFALSMMLGPILARFFSSPHLFLISAGLGIFAFFFLLNLPNIEHTQTTNTPLKSISQLFFHRDLLPLNLIILLLHAVFSSTFIALPLLLKHNMNLSSDQHWTLYLPSFLIAVLMCFFTISRAEKHQNVPFYFMLNALFFAVAQVFLTQTFSTFFMVFALMFFFTGFTALEGFLPSLVSKHAPMHQKGSALGLFSMCQFLGIFIGGLSFGYTQFYFGTSGIFYFNIVLTILLCSSACFVRPPQKTVF